jgi:outer membrane protein assembly factor BamB
MGCGRLGFDSMPNEGGIAADDDADGEPLAELVCPTGGCEISNGFVKTMGSDGIDYGFALASDADSIYLTGFFTGASQDFGGGPVDGPGIHDAMVVRYDHEGQHRFSRRLGGPEFNEGFGVAIGPGGLVHTTGHFQGDVDFGGGPRPVYGDQDVYLVGLDSWGEHVYSVTIGGADEEEGRAVAVDQRGNAYFVGWFFDEAWLLDDNHVSQGDRDVFVISLDADGNHRWTTAYGGTGSDAARGIAVIGDQVVVCGTHEGPMQLGEHDIDHVAGEDGHLVALDKDTGAMRWHQTVADKGDEGVVRVTATGDGNLVATVYFDGQLEMGTKLHDSAGNEDAMLVKLTPDGTVLWSRAIGGAGRDRLISVATGANGEIAATGISSGDIDFGRSTLGNAGDLDGLVVVVDGDGNELWGTTFGGSELDEGQGVTVDAHGRIHVTGCFRGTARFGPDQVTARGSCDTFLVRLDPEYGP